MTSGSYPSQSNPIFQWVNLLLGFLKDSFLYTFLICWFAIVGILFAHSVFAEAFKLLFTEVTVGYLQMILPSSLQFLATPWTLLGGAGMIYGYTLIQGYATNTLWANPNENYRFIKMLMKALSTLLPVAVFGLSYYFYEFSYLGFTFGVTMISHLGINLADQLLFPSIPPMPSNHVPPKPKGKSEENENQNEIESPLQPQTNLEPASHSKPETKPVLTPQFKHAKIKGTAKKEPVNEQRKKRKSKRF